MELFHANQQWATRPADERFGSLEEMYAATRGYYETAVEASVPWGDIRVESVGSEVMVVGKVGRQARLTHHAFGQLASRVGAPAGYLRGLPGTLAAQNLNHGFKQRGAENGGDAQLLFHNNGELLLRAAVTEKYERVWNWEIAERMIDFTARHGMVPARSTIRQFNDDAALYASDHDMFAFIMDPEKVIVDPTGNALRRGFIAGNSEVGAGSLWFLSFLFRDLCGNHIIWGAEGVVEVRLRHVGSIASRWAGAFAKIRSYMDGAGSLDEARMREMTVQIAGTKAEVLDKLFGIKSLGLSRKALEASYDAVRPDEDGDPRTVWGMAQGITRESQAQPFAEDRHAMDRAAGRLMQIAF